MRLFGVIFALKTPGSGPLFVGQVPGVALLDRVPGYFPDNRRDLTLQLPDPRLHGIAADNLQEGLFVEDDLGPVEAVFLQLFRHYELRCDVLLLVVGIAGNLDDLHPVPKGVGNGVHRVCRGDKQDVGQIVGDFQVVIQKRIVLFRIEDF